MALRIETHAEPIPGYRLLERLGGGGFGEVWKCEAPGGLFKAIKIVAGGSRASEGSPLADQELKSLRRMQAMRHPYLLSIERYDVVEGHLLIVTELADGNLTDRFRHCRGQGLPGIPRDDLIRYLLEAAEVLDLMQGTYQLQHLDIKPQNLFLVHDHIKLGDFGLVQNLENVHSRLGAGGTPFYTAPEMFDGQLSRHCDQYSLAIMYQELLTGQRPFSGGSVQQVILQHLQHPPNLSPLPSGDRDIVARALAKRPDERFSSCSAFVRSLRAGAILDPGRDSREPAPEDAATFSDLIRDLERSGQPSEQTGDGVFVPTLVLGAGGLGRRVLQELKHRLARHLGPSAHWPHIRFLYLDTDLDAIRAALDDPSPHALAPEEILPIRLQRANHYLKLAAEGRGHLGSWIDAGWYERLGRAPGCDGVRGLGRLAFVDHLAALTEKLKSDLAAIARPQAIATSLQANSLGLRRARPRAIVVAGLGGGTGSGTAIDLAYLLRHWLDQLSGPPADIGGWFLLPEERGGRTALNASAALVELGYFSRANTTYRCACESPEGGLVSREPPFTDLVFLPRARGVGDVVIDGVELAAEGLFRELGTRLGRDAEPLRAQAIAGAELSFRTFGQARFDWPRRTLICQASYQLALRLLTSWEQSAGKSLRHAVLARVTECWTGQELGPDALARSLHQACAADLGQPPDDLCQDLSQELGSPGARPAPVLAEKAIALLTRLEPLVGRPGEDSPRGQPGRLARSLENAAVTVIQHWGQRFRDLILELLERPGFRLAGAEAAVQMLRESAERAMAHFGPQGDDWLRKASHSWQRIQGIFSRKSQFLLHASELVELARSYPRQRFQGLLLRQVAAIYGTLAHQLAEEQSTLAACRQALVGFREQLAAQAESDPAGRWPTGLTAWLLPEGSHAPAEALARLLADISPEQMLAFDARVGQWLTEQAGGLLPAIQSADAVPGGLVSGVLTRCALFFDSRLPRQGVAALFLHQYPAEAARTALEDGWVAAAPPLAPAQADLLELAAVAVPPSREGQLIADRAREVPGAEWALVIPLADEIVLIRELPAVPLESLPPLERDARARLRQAARADGFSPQARVDLPLHQEA